MHPQDRLFCEIAVQLNVLTREQVARCMKAQQREAGKNIASLAVSLGFMTQPAVENVMQQQQRLLERRREARHASVVQREAESRAAAGTPSTQQAKAADLSRSGHPGAHSSHSGVGKAARRDPTPTSRWVSETPLPNRLHDSDSLPEIELMGHADVDAASIRETVDGRPPTRLSRAARPTQPLDRSDTPEPLGHGHEHDRALSYSQPSAAKPSSRPPFAVRKPPDLSPPAVGPGRTLPPAELRSPVFTAAANSVPVPPPSTVPKRTFSEPLPNPRTSSARPPSRPVPSGRDWRNPSRPPPPSEGFDIEIGPLTPVPRAPSSIPTVSGYAEVSSVFQAEAPPYDAPGYIARALEICISAGASDLLLHAEAVPWVRVDGSLRAWTHQQPLAAEQLDQMLLEILDEAQLLQLSVDGEQTCIIELPTGQRIRTHAYASERGANLVLHVLPHEVAAPETLGLQSALRALRDMPVGICVCSGPAGAGRTTTLWSLTQALASDRALHVVSLESPIEIAFSAGLGLYDQREIGKHVASYAEGIDWAVKQAADVIVVADLSAPKALAASLRASRAGCLVLGGVRASSSQKALSTLLNQPDLEPELARHELSHSLRLLLHQRLVPLAKGTGRTAAFEQLVNTGPITQLIRDDQLQQLPAVLAASKSAGMVSLDDALDDLVRLDHITLAAACTAARSGARFQSS